MRAMMTSGWRVRRANALAVVVLMLATAQSYAMDKLGSTPSADDVQQQSSKSPLDQPKAPANAQQLSTPDNAAPGKHESPVQFGPPFQIVDFTLGAVDPNPVIMGSAAIGQFDLVVRYADDSSGRRGIGEVLDRLAVSIDGESFVRGIASARFSDSLQPTSDGARLERMKGSFVFTLNRDVLATVFGISWGSTHIIYLIDRETGIKSSPLNIFVRSPWPAIVGVSSAGGAFLALVGFLAIRSAKRKPSESKPPLVLAAKPTEIEEAVVTRPVLPAPEVPSALLTALGEGRAMLVLGGGASAQAGYPDGATLVAQLVERLDDALPRSLIESVEAEAKLIVSGDGYNKVMDAIAAAVPHERVAREIQEIISTTRPNASLHHTLAALPWRGVVTLARDTLADGIFAGKTGWSKFSLEQASELPNAIKSGTHALLRPMGDLDRPDALSLSMTELRRNLARWPEFQRQMALLLQTQNFVFIGVGATTLEQFLQAVGVDLEVAGERHFALVPDRHDIGLLSATVSRFGVTLLPYTADTTHIAVSDFVTKLAHLARFTAPALGRPQGSPNEFAASRIEAIKLTNIGLFEQLELKFQTQIPGVPGAAWTVIFGPNGCGKSSILRAIGLALSGNEASAAAGRLLQVGKTEASIELTFGSQVLRTRLVRNRDVSVVPSATTPVQGGLALVLGFPALRGAPSINPKGPAPLEARLAEPADLLPLVSGEVDRRLGSFKQWLINVLEQAGRGDARAVAKKALLDNIIHDVVPGMFRKLAPLDSSYVIRVKIDDKDVASPEDVPFDDLSQGMSSIFNWLGVLVQRMYDFYPQAAEPQKEHAITLIDEIDAHLHPDWQRRLVELSKKFFPNVQVIATSHSPLLAGALRGKEMCVLERDRRSGRVGPLPFDLDFYGRSSQEILTSVVFGLQSDRNPETERLIHRYYDLFEKVKRTQSEDDELQELGQRLNNVSYGAITEAAVVKTTEPEEWSADETEILRKHFEAASATTSRAAS
ncbi:energy-coupling factor transporter ATP-binding protein EcfA2 [Bradyrhizobium sp. GM2.2]|uniref:AAA family ATPase n=2 Tax=unclassified Bradyrhizobium TaxID=2631580 RepID=UPI001FF7B338|nr:AAA family ATPase [Bradyrhizobium sp. CW9]MCK1332154.1 AAA family ATPase [Bradyrhizobium sp. CW9]